MKRVAAIVALVVAATLTGGIPVWAAEHPRKSSPGFDFLYWKQSTRDPCAAVTWSVTLHGPAPVSDYDWITGYGVYVGEQDGIFDPIPYDAQIESGVAKVEAATGLDFQRVETGGSIRFVILPSELNWRTAQGFLGWTFNRRSPDRYVIDSSTIVVTSEFLSASTFKDPGDTVSLAESIWTHELGHALGLAHSGNPASIMYPVLQGNQAFTPGDLAGFAAVGARSCP